MRLCVLTILVLLGTSCSLAKTKHLYGAVGWTGLIDHHELKRSSGWAIDPNVDIYIAISPEGIMDEILHVQLTEIFQRYYPKSLSATYRESLQQSLISARLAGMDYLVYARVRNRLDRNGFGKWTRDEILFSELNRAQLNMDIYIYAAINEQLVDFIQIDAKGGLRTGHGNDLMWEPLDLYLRELSQFRN